MVERPTTLEAELARAVASLGRQHRGFALVGGLAVSIRGEVRFTRDVDLAVRSNSDQETEILARDVAAAGYDVVALVEHEDRNRLATVRLRSRAQVYVDLLVASSGIEAEIVDGATVVDFPSVGPIPVARAEDLLATKILSMSERRPQDRIDARGLVLANPQLEIELVKERLRQIRSRGFHREQNLEEKLESLLGEIET